MSAVELIRACNESKDSAAWEEFISRFGRAISLSIVRIARQWGQTSKSVADDLVQETYLRLCENCCHLLLEFATQHPDAISAYIKTIAANIAHDHFKSLYSQKKGSGQPHESLSQLDPVVGSETHGSSAMMEREVLLSEISRCLDLCSVGRDQERDRLIFWLHYGQGMSARAIAELPAVDLTAKGVESAILRLTRLVRKRIVESRSEQSVERPGQKDFGPQNRIEGRSSF